VAMTDPPPGPDESSPPPPEGSQVPAAPEAVIPAETPFAVVPAVTPAPPDRRLGIIRLIGILVIVAGGILVVAGIVTWIVVQTQLADENITVSEDAERFQGDKVDGPLTAYAQADVIEQHALEASGGLTYAELPRDDPVRDTVMDASFLRASLFTSVVAFGVALMAAGLGVVCVIIGIAFIVLAGRLSAPVPVAATATDLAIPTAPA
jgi:hypothetical protein